MTALTRCPIDGSRIRRNHDGDIECSVALIGNHSAAVMLRAHQASMAVKAPSSADTVRYYREPCPTCGKPKMTVIDPSGDASAYAVCGPCRGIKAGRRNGSPVWSMESAPPNPYYFDGRFTR